MCCVINYMACIYTQSEESIPVLLWIRWQKMMGGGEGEKRKRLVLAHSFVTDIHNWI